MSRAQPLFRDSPKKPKPELEWVLVAIPKTDWYASLGSPTRYTKSSRVVAYYSEAEAAHKWIVDHAQVAIMAGLVYQIFHIDQWKRECETRLKEQYERCI